MKQEKKTRKNAINVLAAIKRCISNVTFRRTQETCDLNFSTSRLKVRRRKLVEKLRRSRGVCDTDRGNLRNYFCSEVIGKIRYLLYESLDWIGTTQVR